MAEEAWETCPACGFKIDTNWPRKNGASKPELCPDCGALWGTTKMPAVRCVLCDFKVDLNKTKGISACPNCGTTSLPCLPADDVTVKVNWHELRILAIWAERWAIEKVEKNQDSKGGRGLIYAICERMEKQFPKKSKLTLCGEINDLRKEGLDIQTNIPGEEK